MIVKPILSTLLLLCFYSLFSRVSAQQTGKAYTEGRAFFSEEKYKEALKCFEKDYKKTASITSKYWIGMAYGQLHEIDLAKSIFLEIVKQETQGKEIIQSYAMLASCHQAYKQKDSAIYYLDQSIKRFPDSSEAYFQKGFFFHDKQEYQQAKPYLDKAIELNPKEAMYYDYRHFIFFTTLDYQSALNDLLMLKKLKPDSDIEFNLAYSYSMLKRYHEADSVFQLIYDEKNASFLNNYGLNKFYLGDAENGKFLIMKSLGMEPKNSYAYRNLAVIAIAEGNTTKACEYLDKAKIFGFTNHYGNEVNDLIKQHCK